jgi:hypothetical protein
MISNHVRARGHDVYRRHTNGASRSCPGVNIYGQLELPLYYLSFFFYQHPSNHIPMAPGLTDTIKQTVTSMTENKKIADLQRDMVK